MCRPSLNTQKASLQKEIDAAGPEAKHSYSPEIFKLKSAIREIDREIGSLNYKEFSIKRKISTPQAIPEQSIKEFELANIIRLGLAKVVYEASAGTHSIEIPGGEPDSYRSVKFDIEINTETNTILTELGELFIEACNPNPILGESNA